MSSDHCTTPSTMTPQFKQKMEDHLESRLPSPGKEAKISPCSCDIKDLGLENSPVVFQYTVQNKTEQLVEKMLEATSDVKKDHTEHMEILTRIAVALERLAAALPAAPAPESSPTSTPAATSARTITAEIPKGYFRLWH